MKASWKKNREQRIASIIAKVRTPERRARQTEINNKRWASREAREKMSEWNRTRWLNREVREHLSRAAAAVWTPERRAEFGEMRRRQWAEDKDYRDKTVFGLRRAKSTPEARALFSMLLKARWGDPAWREKWQIGMRRRMSRVEEKLRLSKSMAQRWRDPAWRAYMTSVMKRLRIPGAAAPGRLSWKLFATSPSAQPLAQPSTLRSQPPVKSRPFSMLAMRGPDPLRALRRAAAEQAGRGRLTPIRGDQP